MKREFLIALMALILVIVLVIGLLLWGMQDVTVLEQVIDDSSILQVRASGWWEGCVPVYLTIHRKKGKTLRSATFSCYSPEDIKSKTLELEIHNVDNIIFIHYEEMPDWILAMVFLKDNLVYPPRGLQEDTYYPKVRKLFSRLKVLLKNDDLELAGNPWYSKDNKEGAQ